MNRGVLNCSGPMTRRTAMRFGSLSLGSLGLGDVLRMQSQAATSASPRTAANKDDNAVIFVWLPGGPPHMEMYDLKPDAPREYRGEFQPITTNVPGIDVGELLPLHAKCADKYTIIRSVAHTVRRSRRRPQAVHDGPRSERADRLRERLSGRAVDDRQDDRRSPPRHAELRLRHRQRPQGIDTFSFGSAYLGSSTHPFTVGGDPSDPKLQDRATSRRSTPWPIGSTIDRPARPARHLAPPVRRQRHDGRARRVQSPRGSNW